MDAAWEYCLACFKSIDAEITLLLTGNLGFVGVAVD